MNQGGLKHAATESRLDNKRERRRGASGRAAALRRAPSDSDCSGETASLSADSGDRAIRPPPPPSTRAAKSRSRRRGSEWEVLEGLKDGQRFEKRPDVFNGYLHKKRKWPLKGWHKRFFVVDGGILVYARSPTDVARGRLHGSVDVGLSVISAKARRRRIDIDADEFIYHLRAKTPDVFRTWLNVLKAHRLYRQHLLTFGARESVPKIHAPLDDLPPTDTSSRASRVSLDTSTLTSNEDLQTTLQSTTTSSFTSPKCPINWQFYNRERKLVFFNFQKKNHAIEKLNEALYARNKSLCSMNCVTTIDLDVKKQELSLASGSTNAEKQILITDLELESNTPNISFLKTESSSLKKLPKKHAKEKATVSPERKVEPTTACYFFSRKKRNSAMMPMTLTIMKKSKKSTNLVKYKNILDEPRLKEPFSGSILIRRQGKRERSPRRETKSHRGVVCDATPHVNSEAQASEAKEHKSLQDLMTTSEYDKITEHLMLSLFENHNMTKNQNREVKYYINQVVKDLYAVKFSQTNVHPVKILFRSLLEYWLKNTSCEQFKDAMQQVKSVHKPSNRHFTQDKILSSFLISNATKQTQFHGISNVTNDIVSDQIPTCYKTYQSKPKPDVKVIRCHSPKRDTESFENERRIQDIERVLKNTVYICETVRSDQSKERDIKITRKLIDNLEKFSKKSDLNNDEIKIGEKVETSDSSSEIPKIQETINHLISETSMPPSIAKEFLNAYLGVLLNESSKSITRSSTSSEQIKCELPPVCDVQCESIQRKTSKNITTASFGDSPIHISYTDGDQTHKTQKSNLDPGEIYLKDMLDKITTVFSKVNNKKSNLNDKSTGDKKQKHELSKPVKEFPEKGLVRENYDENSVVIDLSKYDLEHVSMFSDPTLKGVMSISIKLKEKPPHSGESKRQKLCLKFCNESTASNKISSDDWLHSIDSHSLKKNFDPHDIMKPNIYDFNANPLKDAIELKPYLSSNETMPKAYCQIVHESEHSLDLSFKSSNFFRKEYTDESDDAQPCYIVSSLKKTAIATKLQSQKKKVHVKHTGLILGPQMHTPNQSSSSRYPDEYSVFEQRTPKIIDEKFILLLLENLTLLSKNLPSLYKDLNTLFIKLRKKHEKVIRNCGNIQGLSLLGRIYNDDFKLNDRWTQYEEVEYKDATDSCEAENSAASACANLINQKPVSDRSLSTCDLKALSKITEVQTEKTSDMKISTLMSNKTFSDLEVFSKEAVSIHSRPKEFLTAEMAVSAPDWYKKVQTKSVAASTVITAVINHSDDVRKSTLTRKKHFENVLRTCKAENKDPAAILKQELINRLTFLTPSYRISTQSQTDHVYLHRSKDLKNQTVSESNPCNDFNVYQLSLKRKDEQKSNSMIDLQSEKSDELKTIYRCHSEPYLSGLVSPTSPPLRGPQAGFVSGTPGGRLAGWIIESGGPLENASRELGQAQLSVQQLQRLLEALELQQQVHHDTDVSLEGASPNVKKDRRKFGLRKKKSNSKCASVELAHHTHIDPSSSHMALSALTAPPSPGGGASSVPNSAASLPIVIMDKNANAKYRQKAKKNGKNQEFLVHILLCRVYFILFIVKRRFSM